MLHGFTSLPSAPRLVGLRSTHDKGPASAREQRACFCACDAATGTRSSPRAGAARTRCEGLQRTEISCGAQQRSPHFVAIVSTLPRIHPSPSATRHRTARRICWRQPLAQTEQPAHARWHVLASMRTSPPHEAALTGRPCASFHAPSSSWPAAAASPPGSGEGRGSSSKSSAATASHAPHSRNRSRFSPQSRHRSRTCS